jgi:hypothetical protein
MMPFVGMPGKKPRVMFQGGYAYATDGRIVVRIRADGQADSVVTPEDGTWPREIALIFRAVPDDAPAWPPSEPIIDKIDCPDCEKNTKRRRRTHVASEKCPLCGADMYTDKRNRVPAPPDCEAYVAEWREWHSTGGGECLRRQLAASQAEVKRLEGIVGRLPKLVKDIYELRDCNECWYANEDGDHGDCGNWPECSIDCPLRILGELAGLVPQEDGGTNKQAAAKAAKENPDVK